MCVRVWITLVSHSWSSQRINGQKGVLVRTFFIFEIFQVENNPKSSKKHKPSKKCFPLEEKKRKSIVKSILHLMFVSYSLWSEERKLFNGVRRITWFAQKLTLARFVVLQRALLRGKQMAKYRSRVTPVTRKELFRPHAWQRKNSILTCCRTFWFPSNFLRNRTQRSSEEYSSLLGLSSGSIANFLWYFWRPQWNVFFNTTMKRFCVSWMLVGNKYITLCCQFVCFIPVWTWTGSWEKAAERTKENEKEAPDTEAKSFLAYLRAQGRQRDSLFWRFLFPFFANQNENNFSWTRKNKTAMPLFSSR